MTSFAMNSRKAILLMVLVSLILPANAFAQGDIQPMSMTEVVRGVTMAVQGMDGTSIMAKGKYFLFSWPATGVRGSTGYVILNWGAGPSAFFQAYWQSAKYPGNLISTRDFTQLASWMQSAGWKAISASSIGAKMFQVIVEASRIWSGFSITPIIVPHKLFKKMFGAPMKT